jgi:PilZ domain-containing protein
MTDLEGLLQTGNGKRNCCATLVLWEQPTANRGAAMMDDDTVGNERRGRRLGLSCRVFFFGDNDFEGEGAIEDISTSGCRFVSVESLKVGMLVKLSLFLKDHEWAMRIDEAIVRWKEGQEYGLEFTSIRPAQRERLRALVMNGGLRVNK